ncbi:MAG: flagellar hook-length control protein FliK [Candidatus Methylomirabilia bacterium]
MPEGQPAFSTMTKEGSPAAGTTPELRTLPARETPPAVVDQLVRTATILRQDGRTEMHVRLEPPTLGWVRVSVRASGGSLALSINAERSETQALLSQAIPDLQQALASHGLDVASLIVRLDLALARDRGTPERTTDRSQRGESRERTRSRSRTSAPDPLSRVDLIV